MSASNNSPIPKIYSEINSKAHRFDYLLVVDKFKSLRLEKGFRSDHFSPPGLAEPKFCIECCQYKNSWNNEMKISLFACEVTPSNVYVKYDIKGFDERGQQLFGSNASGKHIQHSKPIHLCDFKYPRNISGDKLKILCEFTFEIDTFVTKIVSPVKADKLVKMIKTIIDTEIS